MSNHTRLHRFEFCYLRSFGTTDSKHTSRVHFCRYEFSIKIQPKEWTAALALKHLLVSWDLWTYRNGFKLPYHYHHLCIDETIRCGGTVLESSSHLCIDETIRCGVLVPMWLSHVCSYDSSSNSSNNNKNNNNL